MLTQSWLMHQFSGNSVSVTLAGGTRQFLRLADGSWIAPGASYATLTQSGTRAPFTYICPSWSATRGADYALSRGWDASGLAFTVINAQGDQQHFSYWLTHYQTADLGVGSECGRASGFRFDTWSFPQGASVTAHYTSGSASDGSNHSSSPNANTSYPSSTTLATVDNSIGRTLTFVANTPNVTDGTRTLQGPQAFSDGSFGVVDPAGDVTDFTLGAPQATSPTQRPVPYSQLVQVATPYIGTNPHTLDLQYDYDALGQVYQVHDAVALQTGARAPYAFYIAGDTRGERDDPLGGAYSVVYDTYKHHPTNFDPPKCPRGGLISLAF